MSKSVNQVTLIGNIGKDPEIRTLENGVKVATFSLATSTGGFKKQDGTDVPEKTSWHNVVCWRGLADLAEKFVKKGDKLTVFGSISYREYEKDGVKRCATDIIAYDIVLMGKSETTSTRPPQLSEADIPEDFPPMPPSDGLPW
ncbi:MAG: single-stranded DNA-binding protein [Bacteroidales bacterium]|nr:single-stranded DNA-binding protein [Bacteroidales bacterium]